AMEWGQVVAIGISVSPPITYPSTVKRMVNPQLPFKSVAELVAYAKENPGRLNYSTGGIGTLPHLNAELFKSVSGTNILHVPYKGGGPSRTAVVAGEVQMTFDTVSTSLQLIRDGKLRALAIVGPKRGIAGCTGNARDWFSVDQQRRLDGLDGAARYAAGDPRKAQCSEQCRAQWRHNEKSAR